MNAESLKLTQASSETWFWSRSRAELWHKGATSGNTQRVIEIRRDCDSDSLVVLVETAGPACHTGNRSCFYRDLEGAEIDQRFREQPDNLGTILNDLFRLIETRKQDLPEGSYTTYLFEKGLDKILKKIGEESSETIIAAKNDDKPALVCESTDLLYHLMVLLVERGVSLDEVRDELVARHKEKTVAKQ
jgi:phosphoribosyl-ATP pyrophosphohydrolase/phosphoribosyl-AMP cyclohydrolase